MLYCGAHGADCKLCLVGHDICWLQVAVVHWVLKCSSYVCVLMTSVAIERHLRSPPVPVRPNKGGGVRENPVEHLHGEVCCGAEKGNSKPSGFPSYSECGRDYHFTAEVPKGHSLFASVSAKGAKESLGTTYRILQNLITRKS